MWFVDSGCQGPNPLGAGLGPSVNARASRASLKAAKTLRAVLGKVLSPPDNWLTDKGLQWASDPAFIRSIVVRGYPAKGDPKGNRS
jgi:hypothetical protein